MIILLLFLLQSEHIGTNVFDLILNEDHKDVKESLKISEIQSMSRLQGGYNNCVT